MILVSLSASKLVSLSMMSLVNSATSSSMRGKICSSTIAGAFSLTRLRASRASALVSAWLFMIVFELLEMLFPKFLSLFQLLPSEFSELSVLRDSYLFRPFVIYIDDISDLEAI